MSIRKWMEMWIVFIGEMWLWVCCLSFRLKIKFKIGHLIDIKVMIRLIKDNIKAKIWDY
jgi:hypothetical protein